MCATALNLARDSIVIVDDDDDRTEGFRPMVSSAVWGKRLRRDNLARCRRRFLVIIKKNSKNSRRRRRKKTCFFNFIVFSNFIVLRARAPLPR